MKNKKDLLKAWDKIELNSSYVPPISFTSMKYDENLSNKITKEGKKKLMIIIKLLKNIN